MASPTSLNDDIIGPNDRTNGGAILTNGSNDTLTTPLMESSGLSSNLSTPNGSVVIPQTPKQFSGSFSPTGKRRCCWWSCLFFSIFLMVVLPLIVNYLVRQGVIEQVVMDSEHAIGYEQFRNRSGQGGTDMEYWFFNITNPHEVLKGERPNVEELGPFIYRQTQLRSDLEFNYENDTLSFRQQIYQTFLPEETFKRTNGRFRTDDIPITTINILFFGMKAVVGKEFWHILNDIAMWNTDYKRMFDVRTVNELIEGYVVRHKIGPVTIPISFPGLVPSHVDPMTDPEYKYKNMIYMGKKNLDNTNSLIEWGPGKRHAFVQCPWGNNPLSGDCKQFKHNPCCGFNLWVKPWGTEVYDGLWNADANMVQGTLGDAFRPFLRRRDSEIVTVWSDQLARPLQFHNRDAIAVSHYGIEMLRFTATREFWSNATVHPPNARYYQFGPDGLLNATILYQGAPIAVSLPHFLGADPMLREMVTGLNPNRDQHDMYLDVEPHTGMTFVEHLRIMVSCHIQGKEKWGKDEWFPLVKEAYVPIGYFNAHSEINHVGVEQFLELYDGLSILWGAMSLGAVFLGLTVLGSPIWTWFKLHHKTKKQRRAMLRQRSLDRVLTLEDDGSVSSLT